MRTVLRYITILILLACPTFAWAGDYMRVTRESLPPMGFVELCGQKPQICSEDGQGPTRVTITPARENFLSEINVWVNRLVRPTPDTEKHRVIERWELLNCLERKGGDCRGDCEEYVLLKRQFLIERGWPVSALLIAAVWDEKGEGHAVLVVRTNVGDLVLDNKNPAIVDWKKLPYVFGIRQSYANPKIWYELRRSGPQTSSTAYRKE